MREKLIAHYENHIKELSLLVTEVCDALKKYKGKLTSNKNTFCHDLISKINRSIGDARHKIRLLKEYYTDEEIEMNEKHFYESIERDLKCHKDSIEYMNYYLPLKSYL